MKIHEYQAKSLLKKYDIPIQDGYVIENIENAEETILKGRISSLKMNGKMN